jgi:hypothetical protein
MKRKLLLILPAIGFCSFVYGISFIVLGFNLEHMGYPEDGTDLMYYGQIFVIGTLIPLKACKLLL